MKFEPIQCSVAPEEVKRIKAFGFLRDKTTEDAFNCRVITKNGKISAEDVEVICEAAKKFGSGEVAFTTRLTVEIQKIPYENVEPLMNFLDEKGLAYGGTGPKVRPIVACKGTTCNFGLIDTYGLSEKIHNEFYVKTRDLILPHKFKIAVGGCPNNCVKPSLNDIGIVGQRITKPAYEKCKNCNVCAVSNACPIKSAKVVDGTIDKGENCNNCGRCLGTCPFGVFEEYEQAYKIYIGGRWGKLQATGRPLSKLAKSEDEVMEIIQKAIDLFLAEGQKGERFADTVSRLGFENVEAKLIG